MLFLYIIGIMLIAVEAVQLISLVPIKQNSVTELMHNSSALQQEGYVVAPNSLTQPDAAAYCANMGRYLVIPKNQAETKEIRGLLPSGNVLAWLGIQKKNGAWTPDDPNYGDIDWTNWIPGGEGNQGESNAGMVWQDGWDGAWYDMNPNGRHHYAVCAKAAPGRILKPVEGNIFGCVGDLPCRVTLESDYGTYVAGHWNSCCDDWIRKWDEDGAPNNMENLFMDKYKWNDFLMGDDRLMKCDNILEEEDLCGRVSCIRKEPHLLHINAWGNELSMDNVMRRWQSSGVWTVDFHWMEDNVLHQEDWGEEDWVTVTLRSDFGHYLMTNELDNGINVAAVGRYSGDKFTVVPKGNQHFAFRTSRGRYLRVEPDGSIDTKLLIAGPMETFRVIPYNTRSTEM